MYAKIIIHEYVYGVVSTLGPNDMHLAVVFIEVFDYIIPQGFTFGWDTVMRPLLNFQ